MYCTYMWNSCKWNFFAKSLKNKYSWLPVIIFVVIFFHKRRMAHERREKLNHCENSCVYVSALLSEIRCLESTVHFIFSSETEELKQPCTYVCVCVCVCVCV